MGPRKGSVSAGAPPAAEIANIADNELGISPEYTEELAVNVPWHEDDVYEDAEGTALPASLGAVASSWQRPSEFLQALCEDGAEPYVVAPAGDEPGEADEEFCCDVGGGSTAPSSATAAAAAAVAVSTASAGIDDDAEGLDVGTDVDAPAPPAAPPVAAPPPPLLPPPLMLFWRAILPGLSCGSGARGAGAGAAAASSADIRSNASSVGR